MAESVGIIGLGEMGLPMARNLRSAGFGVVGLDVNEAAREAARAAGVQVVETPAEVGRGATRAVLCIVRDLAQTEGVLFGDRGVISSGRRGLGIVIMSTLSPASMRTVAERAGQAGFVVLDAPVSGARSGAEAGTLTIMASGPRTLYESCLPYFSAMGKNVFHLGDAPGAGQAAKLANNLMLAAAMVGCAEGLRFGARHGIPEERLLELLRVSTGNGWVVQHWEDVRRWWSEYRPGTTLDIVEKDLRSIVQDCTAAGAPLTQTAACLGTLMDARQRPGR
jgi:3-hydroxyisobutyrate dehydrogenase